MKIDNRHERVFAATADELAALVADFDRIWPTEICSAPRPSGGRLYEVGMMVWEELDRAGTIRAFRVISPESLRAEHWFDVERDAAGERLRHTIVGEAVSAEETIWRERIEPVHDHVIEALFDNIETELGPPLACA
jgi:hypothetical protein